MEFLELREVQLVTPAAPAPSIYCLKPSQDARASPLYSSITSPATGIKGEVTTTLTTLSQLHSLFSQLCFSSLFSILLRGVIHVPFFTHKQ